MDILRDLEASQTPLVGTFCDQGNLENRPTGSKPGYQNIGPAHFWDLGETKVREYSNKVIEDVSSINF